MNKFIHTSADKRLELKCYRKETPIKSGCQIEIFKRLGKIEIFYDTSVHKTFWPRLAVNSTHLQVGSQVPTSDTHDVN
jgi:hypothetical protein